MLESVRVTRNPVWATSEKTKYLCGQIALCRPWQKSESVCEDEKACVGYFSEKKMYIWTGWPV